MKVLLFAWALVMVGCCVEQPNEMSCSITCDDPAYPIPCRVERPEGPFFTCADSDAGQRSDFQCITGQRSPICI